MAYARIVSFEGVTAERAAQMREEMESAERPEGVPASEIVVLHDAERERALVAIFFDSEEDYASGDEALNAMDASETPGRRTGVDKYEVLARMTA